MEEWEDSSNPVSFPKDTTEMYNSSLGHRHDEAEKSKHWSPNKGTTSIFEHGMNPGLISHFAKKGVIDAANYFLSRSDWTDLNREKIAKYVKEKNFPKLAQELGLHTIHCSEVDNQWVPNPPKDLKTKFYNTWSCRGFLTEGMVPIQVARGSHEDEKSEELPRLRNGSLIMSWNPSCYYWGKNIY
jgi:homospermidine synthase